MEPEKSPRHPVPYGYHGAMAPSLRSASNIESEQGVAVGVTPLTRLSSCAPGRRSMCRCRRGDRERAGNAPLL